jgi:N-acetylglucosamine kinase-like BadF-type ATPase
MSHYFLAIDAGGTKTHAIVTDERGNILGVARNGAGNWENIGLAKTASSLQEVISSALQSAGIDRSQLTRSLFAMAGADWPSDIAMLEKMVVELGIPQPITVVNDAVGALFAGTPQGIGVVSIAGTGGKTVARDSQQLLETMGMSLGEAGGAGQLVSEFVNLMAAAYHGQRKKTDFYSEVVSHCGFTSDQEMFQAIARKGPVLGSEFAPRIFDAANADDALALEAIRLTADRHAQDVVGLARQLVLDKPLRIVRAGGLHTAGNKDFDRHFMEIITHQLPDAQVAILDVPPVIGAASYAAILDASGSSDFYKTVIAAARNRSADFMEAL